MKVLIILLTGIIFLSADVKVEKIASGLGVVWGMTFINDKEMVLNQKHGDIKLFNLETKQLTSIEKPFSVLYDGQGGLLDVQYHKGWLYFTYVKEVENIGATTLSRAKLSNNKLTVFEELLVTKSLSTTTRHFGSRITFDAKGHLFFSIGDRGVRPNGQDLKTHAGTILRLNLDGSIPKDNPFVNNPHVLDEIYSYGHRNPQGLFFDKVTKRLYSNEHGPRGGDEINIITKGSNYGWPIISYGKEYWAPLSVGEGTHKKGMEQPLKVYIPSIAPSSLIVYSGKRFKSLKGHIFNGALKLRHLNQIVLNEKGEAVKEIRLLKDIGERVRNVIESPQGYLFVSTDSGNLYKLDFLP